jgi:acyl-CoA thioesterase-1
MQRLSPGFLLLVLCAASPARAETDRTPACAIPDDLTTPSDPLTNVAAALATKNGLDILALGSGSTVGDSGGSGGPSLAYRAPGASFPYKMAEALQSMRPGVRFQLTVKGGRSMTADAMLLVLQQELADHHYDLVLWQTGTVEAVHGVRPDTLRGVLQDGADAAEKAHADLVLIDPQFSRFLRANADLSPYESVLQQVTGNPGVTLFHRFDLTQTWAGSGQVDLERVDRDQRDKTIALLNGCLGQALARFVLTGAGEH